MDAVKVGQSRDCQNGKIHKLWSQKTINFLRSEGEGYVVIEPLVQAVQLFNPLKTERNLFYI
jgi:hypothetical protein